MNGVSISRKPCAYKRLANGKRDLRAHDDVALHVRPPQVDVAIFQPHVFLHLDVFFKRKRRRARFVQNPDWSTTNSTSPVVMVRDSRYQAAQIDRALDGDHKFRAEAPGRGRCAAGFSLASKHKLCDAVAVAQVNEDNSAEIAPAMNPAHQQRAFCPHRCARSSPHYASGVSRRENRVSLQPFLIWYSSVVCLAVLLRSVCSVQAPREST